jgi:hypothetical protein
MKTVINLITQLRSADFLKFIRSGIYVNRHFYILGYCCITIIIKKYRAGVAIESIKG